MKRPKNSTITFSHISGCNVLITGSSKKLFSMAAQLQTPSSHGLPLAAKIFSTAVGSKPFAPRPYLNWSCSSSKLVQKHQHLGPWGHVCWGSFFPWEKFLGYLVVFCTANLKSSPWMKSEALHQNLCTKTDLNWEISTFKLPVAIQTCWKSTLFLENVDSQPAMANHFATCPGDSSIPRFTFILGMTILTMTLSLGATHTVSVGKATKCPLRKWRAKRSKRPSSWGLGIGKLGKPSTARRLEIR